MGETPPPISDRDIPKAAEDYPERAVLGRYASGAGPPPDDPLEAGRIRAALVERTANG